MSELNSSRLTITEAAGILGYSPKHTRRLVSAGHLPARRVGPRRLYLERADVEAYAQGVPVVEETSRTDGR